MTISQTTQCYKFHFQALLLFKNKKLNLAAFHRKTISLEMVHKKD